MLTVDFGSPTYTIPENGGSVPVCLTTDVGSSEPVNLFISTTPKSATCECVSINILSCIRVHITTIDGVDDKGFIQDCHIESYIL